MKVEYSSVDTAKKIQTKVKLRESVSSFPGVVEVCCFVENRDSRAESAELTRVEAVRLLRLALQELEC